MKLNGMMIVGSIMFIASSLALIAYKLGVWKRLRNSRIMSLT